MTLDDPLSAEELFHAALELEPVERDAFLTRVCSGDAVLRAEVDSLLAALLRGNGFLEQPAFGLGLELMGKPPENGSMAGREVGPYKIIQFLARGGMGDVYLAEDKKLGRKVALKFLSQESVGDNWAKRQLIREAQAVAMLDHPNICPVYGLEEHADHSFIVMQYVEGKTLGDMILDKSVSSNQTLPLARQIVSALAEAHAHGVIHRDIKPKNIMVTPSGQVKVLDFGLAKTIKQNRSLLDNTESVSHVRGIQGTVAYMSPEQLRGERLDFSSDIFSLGTVLYEIVSGRNPYLSGTNAEIISAILTNRQAPLKDSIHRTLVGFERVVEKCLQKDKNNRYQSAADLLLDLDRLEQSSFPRKAIRHLLSMRAAGAFALVVLLIIILNFVYIRATRPINVAVLPIVNESGDSSLDYLSDGLTDNLINRLSVLSKLQVRPLTMVAGYRQSGIDPKQVGRDLHADAILVGKISGTKDLPLLETTLLNVVDGSEVWKEQYRIEGAKVIAAEEEIAKRVITKLETRSATDENRLRSAQRPKSSEAHRLYMQGRYYLRNRDGTADIEKAIASFNEAIRLEPTYAQAHAGLADCYVLSNRVNYGHMTTREAMTRAEAAAREALENDDTLPEAHTSLGIVNLSYHWNWTEAEKEFKRAMQLNPNYAPAHYWISNLLVVTGRALEAITEAEIARDLEPLSVPAIMNVCRTRYFARQYDQANACFGKLALEQPNNTNLTYARALVLLQKEQYDECIKMLEALYQINKARVGASLGYTYGIAGRSADATRVLTEMLEVQKNTYIPPQEFGLIYLGMGDRRNALIFLTQAAQEHFAAFPYLAVDPVMDRFLSDPDYVSLMKKFSLPVPR